MTLRIELANVGYGGCAVVEQLDLEVKPGQLVCLLGPNGSGKSTILKTWMGMLKPLAGRVSIDGEPLSNLTAVQRARHLSFVPQSKEDPFGFSVQDVVLMGRSAFWNDWLNATRGPSQADHHAVQSALQKLNIEALAGRQYNALSGGQKQLVLIARALCQDARYMMLDEPTANLDFANTNLLINTIAQLAHEEQHGLVFTTHDPQQALRLNAHTCLIHKRRILAQGPAQNVLSAQNLSATYGVPVEIIDTPQGPWIRVSQG